MKGDYAIYLVVIPIPSDKDETSIPVSSPAIHLTVSEFIRLNPGGILPLVIGMPLTLMLIFLLVRRYRNNTIERY